MSQVWISSFLGWLLQVRGVIIYDHREKHSLADDDSLITNHYIFKENVADAVVFYCVQAGLEFLRHCRLV